MPSTTAALVCWLCVGSGDLRQRFFRRNLEPQYTHTQRTTTHTPANQFDLAHTTHGSVDDASPTRIMPQQKPLHQLITERAEPFARPFSADSFFAATATPSCGFPSAHPRQRYRAVRSPVPKTGANLDAFRVNWSTIQQSHCATHTHRFKLAICYSVVP